MASTLNKSVQMLAANPTPVTVFFNAMPEEESIQFGSILCAPASQIELDIVKPSVKKPTRRGIKKLSPSQELLNLIDVCINETELEMPCFGPCFGFAFEGLAELNCVLIEAPVEKKKKTRRGNRKPKTVIAETPVEQSVAPVETPFIQFGSFTPAVTRFASEPRAPAPKRRHSVPPRHRNAPFTYGFYRFDDFFHPNQFNAGWFIMQDGVAWFMYTYANQRWCISNKLRNRQMHALNGNGSCFSVSVTIDNAPKYTYNGEQVKPRRFMSCLKSESEVAYEDEQFFGVASPPRSSDRKKANKKAHADNGNGTPGSDYKTETTQQKNDEISRDIEDTVQSFERSNIIDVQAIKAQEEDIPAEPRYLNSNTTALAYRRVELAKVSLTTDSVVDTNLVDFDPFLKYYNLTLNHNSSMGAFHDVHFDLTIDVVVQALPAMAGIIHFVFDRFDGTGNTRDHLFAYPIQMVDLSSKDSLSFEIKMELPYRVFNTIRTPYAGFGNGKLKMYLATPMVVPAQMAMPATITLFGRATNVIPYNLKKRVSIIMQTGLVALDASCEQNICSTGSATNVMRPIEIAGQWGFLSRETIAVDAAPGTEVTMINVHPMTGDTPLKQVCAAYSYFRGSIKLKLTCNLSKFQNITLAALFVPHDAPFDPEFYESFAFQEIMFDEKHEAIIKVQFAHGSNWLPIFVGRDMNERAAMGQVHVIVRSPLVSTAPYASAPSCLVQMCAGEDFEVAHPRDFSKMYVQPLTLEGDVLNPEVPRSFAAGTKNLYEDARLPNYYRTFELSEMPMMIPVTCTDSRAGTLGLLQNTHAAWSGGIDYYFVFEGKGQCEIRYDPTKRVEDSQLCKRADKMPMAGYVKFGNSRSNPHVHLRVPFSSLYDYMPTRRDGLQTSLNNSNCNGCLFIAGTGKVRVYRAAGRDFKVHFYNGVHSFMRETTVDTNVSQRVFIALDPIVLPGYATVPYRGTPEPENAPATLEGDVTMEGWLSMGEVESCARNASTLVDELKVEIPETLADLRSLVPEIRKLLETSTGAAASATSVTDSICSLMAGPSTLAHALLSVAKSGVGALKSIVLSIHGAVSKVLGLIAPANIAKFLNHKMEGGWSDEELALIYCIAIICGAMALGVDNGWSIACIIACIGLSIPTIGPVVQRLTERLFETFSAPAVKDSDLKMEAPSPLACGASLLATVITFFVPNKNFNLHATANFGKDIAGVFSGAKALDEMLSQFMDLILALPFVEKVLGQSYQDVAVLAKVDIEAYVAEVKEVMCTDFYTAALTNDKVRQQERLWKTHKMLDRHLPKMSGTNFFFNTALKKVMDEQHKMYRHAMTFKAAGRERFPPFICMFAGETRIGKSTMVNEMNHMVCKMMNWDHESDIYTRNPSDPYFSGLSQQKILYVDDLHTNITSDGADSDMAMVMSFGSNAPWAPRMASIEDKGRTVNCLLGMFCTNTAGEPSYPGIRNVAAYLARRHLVVKMRRRKDVPVDFYCPEYSHAEFVLLDPNDREGRRELDENGKPVSAGNGHVFDFKALWKIFSTRFAHHLIKERRARENRRVAGRDVELPSEELLSVVRELAAHYEDVDYVPIDKLDQLVMEAPVHEGQLKQMCGKKQKYREVLKEFTDEQLQAAVGDIYYVPVSDTFVLRGRYIKTHMNHVIYAKLLAAADEDEFHDAEEDDVPMARKVQDTVFNFTNAVYGARTMEEELEMLDAISPELREAVRKGVARRRTLERQAGELGNVGKRHILKILLDMYCAVPSWLPNLLGGLCIGAQVYLTVRDVRRALSKNVENPAVQREIPSVVVEPEYAKETMPALAMPVKRSTVLLPPEYARETMPALAMPVKRPETLLPPEYAKETMPALAMPVKRPQVLLPPQYAKDMAPALTMPVKRAQVIAPTLESVEIPKTQIKAFDPLGDEESGAVMVSFMENPRASREAQEIVVMESAESIEQATEVYRYNRCGKIHREAVTLHFLFLDDKTVLCNRHFFTVGGGIRNGEKVTLLWRDEEGPLKHEWFTDFDLVHPVPETDVCVFRLPQALKGIRSNWGLIPTEVEMVGTYPTCGVLIGHSSKLDFSQQKIATVTRRAAGRTLNTYMNLDGSTYSKNTTTVYLDGYSYQAVTGGGTCGSILILPDAGGKVYGIHSAAYRTGQDAGTGIASLVYREQLQAALEVSEPIFPQYDSNYMLPEPIFEERERALDVVLTIEGGMSPLIDMTPYGLRVVEVVDSVTTGSMWSHYKRSPISRFFPNEPFRVPAILRPDDDRAPYAYDPRPDIMGKYNKVISPLPADKLAIVVEHMAGEYMHLKHPYKPSTLLNIEEAINGVPGAPFYDAINMHTSPGIPYSFEGYTKKGSLFVEVGAYPNGMPRRIVGVPKVEERFDALLSAAREGKMLDDVIFQEFMKDELLKRAKVFEKPATRGIANPPIDLLLAERAAFLPFIAMLQYNRHNVDCQVGINPMSGIEWTELRHRLEENSDIVFDADYTAFDSTIHPTTLDAFADIVNGAMGGDFKTQLARRTLVRYSYDRISQVTNVRVKIDQGMASGMPFTAVGNSCVNSIYLRVGWLMLAEKFAPSYCDMRKFDANVKCAVYGDDNVVTVKAQVAEWYNLRNIALCLEPFGILMTDGQKNARHLTEPFSTWDKIRFLKRAFVLDPSTRLYLAPLDRKTIIDRVRYTKAKKWQPDLEMRIEMSLMDSIFHGPEYFAAFKYFVNSALEELHLPTVNVSFKNERARWEAQSLLLEMQGPGELTFAEQRADGQVQVYFARETEAPTRLGASTYLRVNGPRLAVGEETNPQGIWKAFARAPTAPPPTAIGGASLAEIVRELDARPSLSLQELRNELARAPGGGITLQQLQSELSRLPQGGGITLAQLSRELDARPQRPGLTLQELVRELDARPCRAISTPAPMLPVPPPVMLPPRVPQGSTLLPNGSYLTPFGAIVDSNGVPVLPSTAPESFRLVSRSQRSDYRAAVDRAEGDLQRYNQTSLSGYGGASTLVHDGRSDIHGWRQPNWLLREQLMLFGRYIPGLEMMPTPHPGGYSHYGMVARNFRRIQEWLEGLGGRTLKGGRMFDD